MNKIKVAVVVSHPIQHFVPQYISWSNIENVDLKVIFGSDNGLKPYYDKKFNREIKWNINLDFEHTFLERKEDFSSLSNELDSFKPTALIIYGYSQIIQKNAIKWSNQTSTKTIMISDSVLFKQKNFFKKLLKKIIIPKIYNKVDLFFSVGDFNESYYENYGVTNDRIIRSSFPIDLKLYDQTLSRYNENRKLIRQKYNIPDDHKVILNVGKLISLKRQRDLVQLSNSLQSTTNKISILLVGTGPDEKELKELSKNKSIGGVIFCGFIPPEELAKYYCACDLYLHSSEAESHSLAISEAIYCSKPIVISSLSGSYGPTDDVRNGLNGLVYKCGNINEMYNKVNFIFNNPHIEKNMCKKSKEISDLNQSLAHKEALLQALNIIQNTEEKN